MLDSDLATLYGEETKVFNQAVKRNSERFPNDFRFQLDEAEYANLRSQNATLESGRGKHRKYLPSVFTELIDNYVDDSVLTLLSKRKKGVSARIYAKGISKPLQLDLEKHNTQYPAVEIVLFGDAHDCFLILDEKEVYHLGASLKDLGKKWFAFSKIEKDALTVVGKLQKNRQ